MLDYISLDLDSTVGALTESMRNYRYGKLYDNGQFILINTC